MEWSCVETVRRFGRVADRDRVLTLQTFTEQNRHGDFAAGRLNPDGRDHYSKSVRRKFCVDTLFRMKRECDRVRNQRQILLDVSDV